LLRLWIVGFPKLDTQEILNSPYLDASFGARYATIVYVLGKYLTLLFWPATLSNDYSFNQIPLRTFMDPPVWLSGAFYIAMIAFVVMRLRSRKADAFAVFFFLVTLSISSNIVVNIGAPLAERLLYVPSFGFALVAAILLGHLYSNERFRSIRRLITGGVIVIILLAGARTMIRNADWRNDESLLLADVRNAPNSARTQKAAGGVLIKKAAKEPDPDIRRPLLEQSIRHLKRALEIYPSYVEAQIDLGMAYRLNGESGKAEIIWTRLEQDHPDHPVIPTLKRLLADSFRAEGLQLIAAGRNGEAFDALRSSLRYEPDSHQTFVAIGKACSSLKDYKGAGEAYRRAVELQPGNPHYWFLLGKVYFELNDWENAREAWLKVLDLDPHHAKAVQGLQAIEARTPGD
jgi:Flp pilus assembly protein TadD